MRAFNRIAIKIAEEYISSEQDAIFLAMSPVRWTKEKFIQEATKKYGDKFDYSKVEYKNDDSKVIIKCKEHNEEFQQTPKDHLRGIRKCRKCQNISIGERNFQELLKQNNISFHSQVKLIATDQQKKEIRNKFHFRIEKAPYDFCVQNQHGKFMIQVQGQQHWDAGALYRITRGTQDLQIRIMIDKGKKQFAQKKGYQVFQIPNVSKSKKQNIPPQIAKCYIEAEQAIKIMSGKS